MKKQQQKIWEPRMPDIEKSSRLAVRLGISQLVAQLLINRGIETEDAAQAYLYPTPDQLHSPFLLHGMEEVVERIRLAMKWGEQIWIFGDYDVDGTTATSLLIGTFRHLDFPVMPYIPNRFEEGYGLNKGAIEKLKEHGCDLLITVDCGITSIEEVEFANSLGIDVIITDHHQPPPGALPPAIGVITPKMPESEYPFDGLAGVGLAFKLAHGLMDGGDLDPFLQSQLDLVALGTVADIAPLTGENRVLTSLGLTELNKRERPGIRALCDVANHSGNKQIVGHTLSFVLGPRINAAGRMEEAGKVVKLLTGESYDEVIPIAKELDAHNLRRREVENKIREQAAAIIEKDREHRKKKGLVVAHRDWHRGVIGIVASRLLNQYYRPVFVLAIDGDEAHGSGRCIDGMNLADSLNACGDLLVKHGGHQAAAGLTIKTENIDEFADRFNQYACEHLSDEDLIPRLKLDLEVQSSFLTLQTIEELQQLEPFGEDNSPPRLALCNLRLQKPPTIIGKEKNHLKLFVTDGEQTLEAVGWGLADHFIALKNKNIRLDLAFEPEINEWNNSRRVQLKISDLHIHTLERSTVGRMFPTEEEKSPVKIVDHRVLDNKQDYLLNLLEQKEPTLLYVRDEKALDQLFEMLGSTEKIGRCETDMSEADKVQVTEKLARGELLAIASNCTLTQLPHINHIVFCHPIPQHLTFFNRCQPAFKHPETTYIHLIYQLKDIEWMQKCISWEYPDEHILRQLYKCLQTLNQNGVHRLKLEAVVVEAQTDSIPVPAVKSGLSILEELQLLTQYPSSPKQELQLLPPPSKKRQLHESETYLNGEQMKQEIQWFSEFQLRQNVKQIWEKVSYECQLSNSPNPSI
jgi:single-stranded-DNA-specific exonuclease